MNTRELFKRLAGIARPESVQLPAALGRKSIVLNLGCGSKIYGGNVVNVDISNRPGVNIAADLNGKFPFEDCFCDGIIADNVIEHLTDLISFMNEAHRVLKPKGLLEVWVPHFKSDWAVADPTHTRFFNEQSFMYFSKTFVDPGLQMSYGIKGLFDVIETKSHGLMANRAIYCRLQK